MPLIREVVIANFKSIRSLTIELGRVNVLIGENGSGKTNLLEGIALACAAERGKLENENLVPRGVRVTDPQFMLSAFAGNGHDPRSRLEFKTDEGKSFGHLFEPEKPSPRSAGGSSVEDVLASIKAIRQELKPAARAKLDRALNDASFVRNRERIIRELPDFVIFAPENSALRIFQGEGQLMPLGSRGEGLFAHLKSLNKKKLRVVQAIAERLALLDWYERFVIPKDLAPGERSVQIRDRFLAEGALFDQRSANEGFLFLLFYFTLFISPETPWFFAIDNIDASLNPKRCVSLVGQLVRLSAKHGKQAIFTTHNPAVLDGLDLADDQQRLFVVERDKAGATRARRVTLPKPLKGDAAVRLSDAFTRGYLGGLPKNF